MVVRRSHLRVRPLEALADQEDLHRIGTRSLRLEPLGLLEHPTPPLQEIGIGLAFEDLHHAVATALEPARQSIEEVVAEPGGVEMIRGRISE